MPLRLSG